MTCPHPSRPSPSRLLRILLLARLGETNAANREETKVTVPPAALPLANRHGMLHNPLHPGIPPAGQVAPNQPPRPPNPKLPLRKPRLRRPATGLVWQACWGSVERASPSRLLLPLRQNPLQSPPPKRRNGPPARPIGLLPNDRLPNGPARQSVKFHRARLAPLLSARPKSTSMKRFWTSQATKPKPVMSPN